MTPLVDSNNYEAIKKRGNDLFKAKKFGEAVEWYTRAIEANRDEAIPYSNRAICFIYLGQYFDAIEDCDRAIKLDPTSVKAYYRLALAQKELSRYDRAYENFEKVLSLDGSNIPAKKELQSLQKFLKDNSRLDLKLHYKPERLNSKKPLKMFDLRNQYSGEKSYD